MIKIIDTSSQIDRLFENGNFNVKRWEKYINSIYENSAHIFKNEVDQYIITGKCTFEKDFLPLINAVYQNPKRNSLHDAFCDATQGLNERVIQIFGREINVDLVLYLGLCNAAGWVTKINGRNTVLLGIEKIIELDWCSLPAMYGLIYHELGHVYQAQYGILEQESTDNRKNLVWQLFTEGTAMYFEQVLVGDANYYHQNINGWKDWCDSHFEQILSDFDRDLPSMTRYSQRYFGDWCDYEGHGDVGYYLGTRFVRSLLEIYRFDEIIDFNIDDVFELYQSFFQENHKTAV